MYGEEGRELLELMGFCLEHPDSPKVPEKLARIKEMEKDLHDDPFFKFFNGFFHDLQEDNARAEGKHPSGW